MFPEPKLHGGWELVLIVNLVGGRNAEENNTHISECVYNNGSRDSIMRALPRQMFNPLMES